MVKEYVKQVDGVYRIGDSRVSLDSLVYLFRECMSPESMVESYPSITLEQVHGALAFYLANRAEIDPYLMEGQTIAEREHEHSRQQNAELISRCGAPIMRIRFQADADLDGQVLRDLRRAAPEIDLRTSTDAGFEGLPDPEVLQVAADEGRVLLTEDRRTMPGHFGRFIAAAKKSPGVILIREHISIAVVIEELMLIWNASGPDDLTNRLLWIPL